MSRAGRIGLSDEQAELLESATQYCRDKSPADTVRRLIEHERGYEVDVFAQMAELGWLGIAIPEAHGGAGLGLAEVVPVVEQMGRNLMAGPFLATTLAAQALIAGGTDTQQASVLPALAEGTPATIALMESHGSWDAEPVECRAERRGEALLLSGTKRLVLDAHVAGWMLACVRLDEAPALVLLDAEAIAACRLRRETVIDETRRSFQVQLDGVRVPESARLDPTRTPHALKHIELAGSLLSSAEMCGGGASCIDYTVAYLKTRKQFGRPIGSYQALKHPVVHAHLGIEQARSHLYAAAHTFDEPGAGEIAVRMAKAYAGPAFSHAADRAIQFHGGYGFTYECDAQLYRRRALWCESQYGDAVHHRRRLADLIL